MAQWPGLSLPYDLVSNPCSPGPQTGFSPLAPGSQATATSPLLSTSPVLSTSPGFLQGGAAASPGGRVGASPGGVPEKGRLGPPPGDNGPVSPHLRRGALAGASPASLILRTLPAAPSAMSSAAAGPALPLRVSAGPAGPAPQAPAGKGPAPSPILGTSPPGRPAGGGKGGSKTKLGPPPGSFLPVAGRPPAELEEVCESAASSTPASSPPLTPRLVTPRTRRIAPREADEGGQDEKAEEAEEGDYAALPEHVVIRNTFLDTPLVRSPSLERLLTSGQRRIRSSPPSVMLEVRDAEDPFCVGGLLGAEEAEVCEGLREKLEQEATNLKWQRAKEAGKKMMAAAAAEEEGRGSEEDSSGGFGGTSEEGREEPVVGSADLPSLGSAQHQLGNCKPCAFYQQGLCRNDVQCVFCHLCEPGEKKRRRKEWLECKRVGRKAKPEAPR